MKCFLLYCFLYRFRLLKRIFLFLFIIISNYNVKTCKTGGYRITDKATINVFFCIIRQCSLIENSFVDIRENNIVTKGCLKTKRIKKKQKDGIDSDYFFFFMKVEFVVLVLIKLTALTCVVRMLALILLKPKTVDIQSPFKSTSNLII